MKSTVHLCFATTPQHFLSNRSSLSSVKPFQLLSPATPWNKNTTISAVKNCLKKTLTEKLNKNHVCFVSTHTLYVAAIAG